MEPEYIYEASELGWPPGQWPQSFTILNEVFVFLRFDLHPETREVVGARYASNQRSALVVND